MGLEGRVGLAGKERLQGCGDVLSVTHLLPPQLADGERRCRAVEAEYTSYREANRAQPESQLQAQISMMQLEKVCVRTHAQGPPVKSSLPLAPQSELERKLSSVARSKLHYKQQWSRALQELAVARQREQSALKDKLLRQEQEVSELRKTVQLSQEAKVGVVSCHGGWGKGRWSRVGVSAAGI